MYMKEYVPTVVVQVVMDKVSYGGCEEKRDNYVQQMYNVHVHENRILTSCGCAGSDGQSQGVMEDVKRRERYVQ